MARAPRPDSIIVFSHLRWDFVFQRPQHLLTRAAEDFDVRFIEEPLFEGDVCGVRREERNGVTVVQPLVPAALQGTPDADDHVRAVAAAEADSTRGRLILWFYTPMALPFADNIAADAIVFDKMDELAAFAFAPPMLKALEAELLHRADVVFTGGAALYEAAAGRHANLHCFPSSIDAAHFGCARAKDGPDPADQAGIARPRIGFFGVIDERMDLELVRAVAALRPDWQFVFLGPVVKIDPAILPQGANIHWLGSKPYAELPAYLAHWDAGWMPFALNDATRFISPTKTPEFLAAGLPVVSTPITDVVRPYGTDGLVQIAATPTESAAALASVLAGPEQGWRIRVDARLAFGSWDRTWAAMRDLIEDACAASTIATTARKETANV